MEEEEEVTQPLIKRIASIGVIVLTMTAIAVQLLYINKQKKTVKTPSEPVMVDSQH
jgi:hypothetical protein